MKRDSSKYAILLTPLFDIHFQFNLNPNELNAIKQDRPYASNKSFQEHTLLLFYE